MTAQRIADPWRDTDVIDARAPRFNQAVVGIVALAGAAAALAWWLGAPAVGTVLGALVACLALLAAVSGFCAGCELYRLGARLRGISPHRHSRIEVGDLGALDGHERAFVEFTHPLCGECRDWERRLSAKPDPLVKLDVRERPELARKYGIAVVPTVLAVAADGEVLERLAP